MDYFIVPLEGSDFRADESHLEQLLRVRWPDLKVEPESWPYCVKWYMRIADRSMEVALSLSREYVALDGDLDDCADFAIWYRKFVPTSCQLTFYDLSLSAEVTLDDELTAQKLADAFR